MPTISILIEHATPTGDVALADVGNPMIQFYPVRQAKTGYLLVGDPFQAPLTAGAATVLLDITPDGYAYKAVEHFPGGVTRYFIVTGDSDYETLVDVDPTTLAPAGAPPTWAASLDAAIAAEAATVGAAAAAASAAANGLANAMNSTAAGQLGPTLAKFRGTHTGVFVTAATPTANFTATTLAASASIGATTLSLTATLTPGPYLVGSETVTITAVTGSGPYTATLAVATAATHASAAAIATTALDYTLLQGIGDGRFVSIDLKFRTNSPPAYTYGLNQLSKTRLALAMLSVDELDTTHVVRAGTWQGSTVIPQPYGGTYRYSVATGASVTWTSPVACTSVGTRVVKGTNGGGLYKVTVDGSTATANLLPTAQQMVDSGLYPNTILSSNGGTLAVTDRVLSCYAHDLDYDVRVAIAEGLTSATHTVVMTHTGYSATAAIDSRVYLSAMSYGSSSILPTTSDAAMFTTVTMNDEEFVASAWEFADEERATGAGTLTFIGNGHGYERQESLTVWLGDVGAPTVMTAGQTLAPTTGADLTFVRTSTLFHPNYAGGATPTKTAVTTYTLDRNGLQVQSVITYLVAMECDLAYVMLPVNGALSTENARFNRAALLANSTLTFDGISGDNRYGASRSAAVWMWSSTGNVAALMWVPDIYGFTENWARNGGVQTSVEDRNGQLTKTYFSWLGSRGGAKTVPAGYIKTRTARYVFGYFTGGAETALAAS